MKCLACKRPRTGLWALLFGPPREPDFLLTRKDHLCPTCYRRVLEYIWFLQNLPAGQEPPELKMKIEGFEWL